FHLLELMDVDYEVDVDELNDGGAQVQKRDEWTQFILKQTEDVTERITRARASGSCKIPDAGSVRFARPMADSHTVTAEADALERDQRPDASRSHAGAGSRLRACGRARRGQ